MASFDVEKDAEENIHSKIGRYFQILTKWIILLFCYVQEKGGTMDIRKILCIFFALSLVMLNMENSKIALADTDGNSCDVGIAVVGNYSYWNDLKNLNASTQIGDSIYKAFKPGSAKKWKIGFRSYDAMVDVNTFKGKSLGGSDHLYADNVDLLIYAGHGLTPGAHGANDYSLALCYNKKKYRAKQSEMYLGNKDLEWFITFTCNFCKGSMSQLGHMAKGLHALCGFSTGVILTSDMGTVLSAKLKKGVSVKEAFFATAKETQPWRDKGNPRIANVFTTKSCANDRIWGYGNVASDPKPYSSDPTKYVKYAYKIS